MAEILILEADEQLGMKIRELLTQAGHICRLALSIPQAQAHLSHPDRMYLVMNARLPWAECHPFLSQTAQRGWPVLFVTGEAGNQAHLEALYQGPCRVLVHPQGDQEWVRRVNAFVEDCREKLSYGSLQLNRTDRQVLLEGRPLSLTAQEFALLEALMQSPETALSREHLLRTAWGYLGVGETRTVDVHVQRLRKKLGVERIETVYKQGYRLRLA